MLRWWFSVGLLVDVPCFQLFESGPFLCNCMIDAFRDFLLLNVYIWQKLSVSSQYVLVIFFFFYLETPSPMLTKLEIFCLICSPNTFWCRLKVFWNKNYQSNIEENCIEGVFKMESSMICALLHMSNCFCKSFCLKWHAGMSGVLWFTDV